MDCTHEVLWNHINNQHGTSAKHERWHCCRELTISIILYHFYVSILQCKYFLSRKRKPGPRLVTTMMTSTWTTLFLGQRREGLERRWNTSTKKRKATTLMQTFEFRFLECRLRREWDPGVFNFFTSNLNYKNRIRTNIKSTCVAELIFGIIFESTVLMIIILYWRALECYCFNFSQILQLQVNLSM